ncbi:hypothetical protein MLD38_018185 [Melastoma candidum]|uniref:Uncharacterized protein n=1 Tax=Melastoma candidum TaxID=119954 RepID=A0ACB9QSZ5_9MYRT|nr:hypothetical protein MLD38_018185 [Melastoma candidum]
MKEELLEQVQDTGLFRHPSRIFCSTADSQRTLASGIEVNVHENTSGVCCQVAEILCGKSCSFGCTCCRDTRLKCLKTDESRPISILSGTVVSRNTDEHVFEEARLNSTDERIDVLPPRRS